MTPSSGSPSPSGLSRRRLLQSGLAAGGVAALGLPTLSACSNEGRGGGGSQAADDAVQLPDHIPYEGVEFDLVGRDGVADGLLTYPADPVQAVPDPPGDGQPVSAMVFTNAPAPPGLDRNAFWQELNARLGFELSLALVPSADYSDRFQTTVAGDQLPDLFCLGIDDAPSLPGLLNEKAADLTPLLSGGAVADYPMLANLPTDAWRQTVYGGRIYGVPVPRGAGLSSVLYGRVDLLADRGVTELPTSWESFYDLCTQVSGQQANTWALGGVPMVVIRQMFGVPNAWAEDGGRLVSAYESEGQQEALEAGRRLVADGLTHPDSFGVEQPQRKTWIANETTAYIEDTFTAWFGFYELGVPEGFGLTIYPPPMADGGGTAAAWLGNPMSNFTSISIDSADRAGALLSVLDFLAAPFGTAEQRFKTYGLEGVHHELDGSNPVLTDKGRSEIALGVQYLSQGPHVLYLGDGPEAVREQFDAMTDLVPTALADPTLGLYSETKSRRGTQLTGVMDDLTNDILQGRKPVSAWAEGVATWKSDGGDTIRDELLRAMEQRVGG